MGKAVASSDIYALGATLIHLITGTQPAELPQKNSRIQFSDRVSLSPDLISWIQKATEIAIEKRFSSAKQAKAALISRKANYNKASRVSVSSKLSKPSKTRIQVKQLSEHKWDIHIPLHSKSFWEQYYVINSINLTVLIASG